MAKFIGAVRQVRVLEQQHSEMRQFFSPAVVETLIGDRLRRRARAAARTW